MRKFKDVLLVILYLASYLLVGNVIMEKLLPYIDNVFVGILIISLVPLLFILPILILKKEFIRFKSIKLKGLLISISLIILYFVIYSVINYKTNAFSSIQLSSVDLGFVFSFVLFGPVIEEIIYRGIVIEFLLEKKMNDYWIILISSILFGLAHYNMSIIEIINAIFIGLIIGFLYIKYKNLGYCILAHMLFNLLTGILIMT